MSGPPDLPYPRVLAVAAVAVEVTDEVVDRRALGRSPETPEYQEMRAENSGKQANATVDGTVGSNICDPEPSQRRPRSLLQQTQH